MRKAIEAALDRKQKLIRVWPGAVVTTDGAEIKSDLDLAFLGPNKTRGFAPTITGECISVRGIGDTVPTVTIDSLNLDFCISVDNANVVIKNGVMRLPKAIAKPAITVSAGTINVDNFDLIGHEQDVAIKLTTADARLTDLYINGFRTAISTKESSLTLAAGGANGERRIVVSQVGIEICSPEDHNRNETYKVALSGHVIAGNDRVGTGIKIGPRVRTGDVTIGGLTLASS